MACSGLHVALFTPFILRLFQHCTALSKLSLFIKDDLFCRFLGGTGGFPRSIICVLMLFIDFYLLAINPVQ